MLIDRCQSGVTVSWTMIDVVCGVIQDEAGCYLACLRPHGKHLGGLWEFPGGKVEAGESAAVALVREMQEELGVHVEVGAPLTPVVWAYDERTIRLIPLRCRIVVGTPHPHEHEKFLWCRAEDFGDLAWAPADIPILHEILGKVAETVN